jgi:hypothetical protein
MDAETKGNEMKDTENMIFGRTWDQIKRAQAGDSSALNGGPIVRGVGDYGSDPLGNGMVKMVPSGDVVTISECNNRLR